ncbi:hypothetical protein U1Q18_008736 [Sarracenia purpurea var. burkii]
MSHFRGCNNLVTIMTSVLNFISFFFFFFFFFLVGDPVVAGPDNYLVERFSREELVQIAGYGEEKLSTVLISGTLLCQSCYDEEAQTHSHPVSGALVSVSCNTRRKSSKSNWVEGTTDDFGDFIVDLPSHLHGITNLDRRCLVKVLRLPKNSLCHPTFTGKQKGLKLSSVGNGIRTYTAEILYLTPKTLLLQRCTNRVDHSEEKDSFVKAN